MRKWYAVLRRYMHIPHPEKMSDEEFEEAKNQYNWIKEIEKE